MLATRTVTDHRAETPQLIAQLRATGDRALRAEIVELHLPLVGYLVRRFRERGQELDDLMQVGSLALIKAVDRFDPERGVDFATYAVPTILGELKRHFRDNGWAVRVPRGTQERSLHVTKATERLASALGRRPTVEELADATGMTHEQVIEGREARHAYTAASLDGNPDDADQGVAATLGDDDPAFARLEELASLAPAVAQLAERERTMLYLRFFRGWTQTEIAEHLGISQMHVSRQLRRALAFLRERTEDPAARF